jgi:peptide/nickel transport system substrate-binding protein
MAGAILKRQLEQIGLKVTIKHDPDYATLVKVFGANPPPTEDRANLYFEQMWPDYNSPLDFLFPLFYSKSVGQAGDNGGYYSNPKVDSAIEAAQKATTTQELVRLFAPIQRLVAWDDPAGVFLVQSPDRTAVSSAIKGNVFNALYLDTFDFYALSR